MSRRRFIESHGATCRNWRWSWAFINEQEKVIIFGAWEHHTQNGFTEILGEDWEKNKSGRKNSAYLEAREYLRLVEEEGYTLKTFTMVIAEQDKNIDDPKKRNQTSIKEFVPRLTTKTLNVTTNEHGRTWRVVD